MPTLSTRERIERLKKARDTAQAVKSEIDRQNQNAFDPDDVARREPTRQRAESLIQDADNKIEDLESSQSAVTVDDLRVDRLNQLAAKLDAAIAANALVSLGIDSLTQVLNGVAEVKDALA